MSPVPSGPPTPYHLGFLIGPRINAGGRIGDAALGARLLTLTRRRRGAAIAEELDRLNRERQVLEAATLEEALARLTASLDHAGDGAVIVASGEVGIRASSGSSPPGSKRSSAGPPSPLPVDGATGPDRAARSAASISAASCAQRSRRAFLIKGGGHAMAAGLPSPATQLGDFRGFLEDSLAAAVAAGRAERALFIDAALTAAGAKPELIAALERAGPFGSGNPGAGFRLSGASTDRCLRYRQRAYTLARAGRRRSRSKASPFAPAASRWSRRCCARGARPIWRGRLRWTAGAAGARKVQASRSCAVRRFARTT